MFLLLWGEDFSMKLKKRKVRRGARRHIEHVLDGRPLTAWRARGTFDTTLDDGLDDTIGHEPMSLIDSITAAALADLGASA